MAVRPNSTFGTNLRPELSDAMEKFDLEADQAGCVGLQIAPALEVDLPAGEYGVLEIADVLKNRQTVRNSDGSYNRGDTEGGKDSYSTSEHGFEMRVDDRDARIYGLWWDAEMIAAKLARDAVVRNHNSRVIAAALSIAGTQAAGTVWSTTATATPIDNVRAAKIAIRNRTGVIPDAMCIEWEAFEMLRDCAQIIDRLKYSGHTNPNRDNITIQAVAQALDLKKLIVAGSMANSANEPQAATLASQWTRTKALVFKSADGAGRNTKSPQFMRTFHWGADGSEIGGVFESYEDPSRRGQIVRSRMETHEKVMYAALGQQITGVLA